MYLFPFQILPVVVVTVFVLKYIYDGVWFPFMVIRHFNKQGIGGPEYRPIYGNSEEIRRKFDKTLEKKKSVLFSHEAVAHRADPFCQEWFDKCGKAFVFCHGSIPRLALLDPEMIKEVMLNLLASTSKNLCPLLSTALAISFTCSQENDPKLPKQRKGTED